MRLTIVVDGRPAPQGSKEHGSAGQLREASVYLPAWRAAVKLAAYRAYRAAGITPDQLPLFGKGLPVILEQMTFMVGPDQCRAEGTDEPTGMPDIDKLLRAVLDALGGAKNGGARVLADDAQVTRIRDIEKVRAGAFWGTPGAIIIISDGRD